MPAHRSQRHVYCERLGSAVIDDNILVFNPRTYRTTETTINAFWYLVKLNEPDRLKAWLEARPMDAPTLLRLYEERKNVRA